MNILILVVVAVSYVYAALLLLRIMGRFNFFVTLVPEGYAKAIVSAEGMERMVMQWEGHTFHGKVNKALIPQSPLSYWNVVEDKRANRTRSVWRMVLSQLGLRGLRWVGIPGVVSVYTYKFRWTSLFQQANLPEGKVVTPHEKKRMDRIILKPDVYYIRLPSVEDRNLIPLDLDILLTVRITNPCLALFFVQEWLEMITNRILPAYRRSIGTKEWKMLQGQLGDMSVRGGTPSPLATDLAETIQELLQQFGTEIVAAELIDITPGGDHKLELLAASTAEWEATQQANAAVEKARGDAAHVTTVYHAIQEMGDVGLQVRALEALEAAGAKEGNWIIPLGGLGDLATRLVGQKRAKSLLDEIIALTSDERDNLLKLLRKDDKS